MITNGSAIALGQNCWQLATSTSQTGTVWSASQINLNQAQDIRFSIRIDTIPPAGWWTGDGMAFLLQRDPAGTAAIGGNNRGQGYALAPGLIPSIAVEFDIFDNTTTPQPNEMAADHIAIVKDGDYVQTLAGPVAALANSANIDTARCFAVRVVWNPPNSLEVFFNGVLRLTLNNNLVATVFSGNPMVYFGWTGATGGAMSTQVVCYEFARTLNDTFFCASTPFPLTTTGGTSYLWSMLFPNNISIPPIPGLSANNIASPVFSKDSLNPLPDSVFYVVQVTNSRGCVDVDTLLMRLNGEFAFAGNDTSICGDSLALNGQMSSALIGTWSSPDTGLQFSNPNLGNAVVYGLGPGLDTLIWTVDSAGCSDADTLIVNSDIYVQAMGGPDFTFCITQFNLAGQAPSLGNAVWTWSGGEQVWVQDSLNPTTEVRIWDVGMYSFIWTVQNGICQSEDTVSVAILGSIFGDAGPGGIVCGDTFLMAADTLLPNQSGYWEYVSGNGYLNSMLDPHATLIATDTGTVIYNWQLRQGFCKSTSTVRVHFDFPETINAGADQFLFQSATVLAANQPIKGFGQWFVLSGTCNFLDDSLGTSPVTGLSPAENWILWTITNGACPLLTDSVLLFYELEPFIPDAFSPNDDNKNESFVIRGIEYYPGSQLDIFNRWGNRVYFNSSYSNEWSGQNQDGVGLPDDTYYYLLQMPSGKVFKGFVILKR